MHVRRIAMSLALVLALAPGCGSDADIDSAGNSTTVTTTATATAPASAPEDMKFVADYSRYLWHKRRLVIQTTNHGDVPVEVTSIALRTGHFTDLPSEPKSTTIAPGARVDVQVDFGEIVSCTETPEAPATVHVGLRTSGAQAATDHIATLDPAPLDVIRDRECARQRVTDAADIAFGPHRIIDDAASPPTMYTTLEVRRLAGDEPVTIESLQGSVIIALQPETEREPVATLATDAAALTVPVELFVSRCEAHAVSQSTLTWVVSAFVTVGDAAEPHKLTLAIDDSMQAELQAMIQDCIAAQPPEG